VVTSGTAFVGTGMVFDESKLVAYPVGSYFVTPAGTPHFIFAKDGDFSVLDHGYGPSGFQMLDRK
ncbi:MAG: cupin domain-containing protein, partial [Pseudomonadota bacterium]